MGAVQGKRVVTTLNYLYPRNEGSMIPSKRPHRRAKSARVRRCVRLAVEAMENRVLLSTYTVNTFNDQSDPVGSKTISVRDAIALAAGNPGDDTINIPAGYYPLTLGELIVSDTTGKLTLRATGGSATFDGLGQSLD